MKKLMFLFAAGCLGGLTMSLVAWQFGVLGITSSVGVSIAPALSPEWLYPRVVWGGMWGMLFTIPFLRSSLFLKGIALSLLLTFTQFFFVSPLNTYRGLSELDMGLFPFLFVLFFNGVWGLVTTMSIKYLR